MPDTRKIIRNAYILPCDGSGSGGVGTVTIRNERITSVSYGRSRPDVPAPDVEVVDGEGKFLLPGFIDLHVHGESLLLDLFTAGEPHSRWHKLPDYVATQSFWHEKATVEDWRRLYTSVYFLALRSGITFLGEFGVPGGDNSCSAALDAFQRTELPGMLTVHNADQLERVQKSTNSSLRYSLALPPADELTTYNLQASLRLSKEAGLPLMVHLGDPEKDEEVLLRNFGKGTFHLLDEFGILSPGSFLVHADRAASQDVQLLMDRSIVPIVSPGGSIRRGVPPPPLSEYRTAGLSVAMCTDWGPFSHWSVMRSMSYREMAAKNQAAPALACLESLTTHAAAVLGMSKDVGMVAAGMRANLQLVRCRSLELQGGIDLLPPATVAHAVLQRASTSDVSDVMVNGEFCIREGTVLTYSEEDLVNDLRELLALPSSARSLERGAGDETLSPEEDRAFPEGVDEGFRIIRRGDEGDVPRGTILPLDPDREKKKELPKTARRVFGDDEIY